MKSLDIARGMAGVGPAPQGAGGLKSAGLDIQDIQDSPAPQGAGGLKYLLGLMRN